MGISIKRYKKKINSFVGSYLAYIIILIFSGVISDGLYSQVIEKSDSIKIDSINTQLNDLSKTDTIRSNISSNTDSDSISNKKKKLTTPARATLYSMILPGLGQTYNGKYWKVPIIYSVFAGIFFMASENNYKYHLYKDQYKLILGGDTLKPPFDNYTEETLLQRKDYYKRNRDFQIILGVLAYGLNILDANVDAHLMDYDITPDLTLHVEPEINNCFISQNYSKKSSFGIKFVLSMH